MKKVLLSLIIILAIASFFRLWQLDLIPPGLYPDEAINANEAFQALQTRNFQTFYPENNGREGLYINLIAFSFYIFGASIWSIKIVSAVIGILTVLGIYLLAKELFRKSKNPELIALLSSFFLATSFWHINFSRIGFRAIFVPFVLVFSFYFLFKGFRTKKIANFIAAGIIFGVGFHTYIAFRLIIILIPITLLLWLLIYRRGKEYKKYFLFALCFLFFTFIIASPIGLYFYNNPNHFVSRATGVSIFAQPNMFKAFGESLVRHLAMFNFYGDANWRHNIAESPVLFWPVGIFFLIGLIISIKKFIFSIKDKDLSSLTTYLTLLGLWFVMLLPGILTYEGIPHSLRCIGAIPPTFIFAALGFNFLYQKIKTRLKLNNKTKYLAILSLLLVAYFFLFAQYYRYFITWGENFEVKGAFTQTYTRIGQYLNFLPEETQKYVIVNEPGVPVPLPDGLPMPAQTIMFMENTKFGSLQSTYLTLEEINKIKVNNEKTIIIPMKYDGNLFDELTERFPQGEVGGSLIDNIWAYYINF
jgi:4-amino-4-deoxy-L-arabinose transferase-like glycosyltransferase